MNFWKNLDFGQNFRKISILVKIFENLDFDQSCGENHHFGKNLGKISILVKFWKVSIFVKN